MHRDVGTHKMNADQICNFVVKGRWPDPCIARRYSQRIHDII
jgi:hypothetical protein